MIVFSIPNRKKGEICKANPCAGLLTPGTVHGILIYKKTLNHKMFQEKLKLMELIKLLAERYPQLYTRPSEDAEEAYLTAATTGERAGDDLSHFIGSEEDWLRTELTPAGPVEMLFFCERADFETFLRCIAYRCRPVEILQSVGAQTFFNLRNWEKIHEHEKAYLAAGGTDWPTELRRFDADREKSRDTLILLSKGPYSAVPWQNTPYSKTEWLRISLDIRRFHECAHVVCRRRFPEQKLPLWDELTADLTGLRMATGSYDSRLAAAFLGITQEGYVEGGRLKHYLEQGENADEAARELWQVIGQLTEKSAMRAEEETWSLLLDLTREPLLLR